jgi:hypothetical protein
MAASLRWAGTDECVRPSAGGAAIAYFAAAVTALMKVMP